MRSIRIRMFVLTFAAVVAPVAVLTVYFSAAHIAGLEQALRGKAASFARMVGEQTKSSLSFDDIETVREAFDSAAVDEDVAFLGLYRAGGRALFVQGESSFIVPTLSDSKVIDRQGDHVRAHADVTSAEGYAGVIVVELSTVRAAAAGGALQRTAILIGIAALLSGCLAAWLVVGSFGRRIARSQTRDALRTTPDTSRPPRRSTEVPLVVGLRG